MVIGFHQILEDISCLCVFTIQKSMNSFHQFKFIPMRGDVLLHYTEFSHCYLLWEKHISTGQSKMPRDYTLVTGEYTL